MALQERALRYFREERARKLRAIELMSSGVISTSERTDGGPLMDTTARSIATNREHVAELEQILTEAGVPLDS